MELEVTNPRYYVPPPKESLIKDLAFAKAKLRVLKAVAYDDGDEHTAEIINEIYNTVFDTINYLKDSEDEL